MEAIRRPTGHLKFIVGKEKEEFKLQKPALQIVSPTWEQELNENPNLDEVTLADHTGLEFRTFLKHVFPTEDTVEMSAEDAILILHLARDWQVDQVVAMCENRLLKEPPSHNLLQHALQHDLQQVHHHCVRGLALDSSLLPDEGTQLPGHLETARHILDIGNERDAVMNAGERRTLRLHRRSACTSQKETNARVDWRRLRLEKEDPTLQDVDRLHLRVSYELTPLHPVRLQ